MKSGVCSAAGKSRTSEPVGNVSRKKEALRDPRGQLEQRCERWCVLLQRQQLPRECELERGLPLRSRLICYCLRATAQQKQQGKRDAFPGRQGQRSTLVQSAGESRQRRRANRGGWPFPRKRVKAAGILWCGGHRGTDAPRSVTRGPLF